MTVVLDADGEQLALTGPLSAELATLHGAAVAIEGSVGESSESVGVGGRSVTVTSYTIESIAGQKPVVGIIRVDSTGLWLDTTRLAAAPEELTRLAGAKLWVVGNTTASGALEVTSYGVLRQRP